MPLTVGARLGPYEILAPLGAGGMGEVYRARDPRFGREVALKILPEADAADPDRQRRFAEEIKAVGALNHPNILAVYDVGVADGVPYLVSELVDGAVLRDELDRGAVPVKRLLQVGAQIADGLAAAHQAGIVHRDLKPENVMVTRDGRVKILDFGLAKSQTQGPGGRVITQTATGLIVGTVPYMSPEQARGGAVDFRSDQFAVGLMLYEMATGEHAFRRDTPVQTMSAIIGDEPRPVAARNPKVPGPLVWVIERCLAKDPAERYGATVDLAHDLRQLRDRLQEAVAGDVATPVQVRARRLRWLASQAGVLLAGGLAAALTIAVSSSPRGANLDAYAFSPLATDAGYQGSPAWSPDGKTIAYVAAVDGLLQVFTRSLSSPLRHQVTHEPFDSRDPFWSPDGSRIYFHRPTGEFDGLWSVPAVGGTAELVVENANRAAISPDGRTLALLRYVSTSLLGQRLWIASSPETFADPKPYERGGGALGVGVLRFSPDGSKLAVWGSGAQVIGGPSLLDGEEDRQGGMWVIPMPEGQPYRAFTPPAGAALLFPVMSWLPDNRRLVVALSARSSPGSHLFLVDIETTSSIPLTMTPANEGAPAVSPDGRRLAFTVEDVDFDLVMVPTDGTTARPLLSTSQNELDPAWSPNALQYAFVSDRTGTQEIWLRSAADGGWDRPLVTDEAFSDSRTSTLGSLAFSPDGQRLAYQRRGANNYRIYVSSLAGGSPVAVTPSGTAYQDAVTWSPDGEWVAYVQAGGERTGSWQVLKSRVGGGGDPVVVQDNVALFARPQWSPDGRWIACRTNDGLTLASPDGKGSRVISTDEWIVYSWSADGRDLFGLKPTDRGHFMLASIDVASGAERVHTADLGPIPLANQPIRGFSLVPNQGFVTSIARVRSDIWLLEGFEPPAGPLDGVLAPVIRWVRR
jgi:Tol biopolymer transport system component